MGKTFKKILCTLLVVVMCLTAAPLDGFIGIEWSNINLGEWFGSKASSLSEGDYTYKILNNEAIITDVKTTISGHVVVPESLGGYCVTTIGDIAFSECKKIIGVSFPSSITTIGKDAFWNCVELVSVTIGANITSIDNSAFSGCNNLAYISVDNNNTNYCSIDGVLFNKNKTNLIQYCIGNARSCYEIPEGVITIDKGAFFRCTHLTNIVIPNSVTTIEANAFKGCSNLVSSIIPNSVTLIEYQAFYGCTNLTNITIGSSVTSIGFSTFEDCTNLTNVIIPNNVTSIGSRAFYNCINLKSVSLSENIKSISKEMFSNCKSLDNIKIPNSITSIEMYAFESCVNLTSIIIPNNVTAIYSNTFNNCTSLSSVIIGEGVLSIYMYAFLDCTSLTSITIPQSVTSIHSQAFSNCLNLADFIVDKNNNYYTSIDGVLLDKEEKQLVSYPAGNTRESYTIPDTINSIGKYAFFNCLNLTDITISNSLTSIDSAAFYNFYSNIENVYYKGTEEQWKKINISSGNSNLLNATIHFLDEEPELDGYKLRLRSDGAYSDSIAVGKEISLFAFLWNNDTLLDCERAYAISFDNPGVFDVVKTEITEPSFDVTLKAIGEGTTNMTISDSVTGAYVTMRLKANVPLEVLTMEDVKNSAENHDGIETHFYDYNGLYVNNYRYSENRDGSYDVRMSVYNKKAHLGAVVVYDENGAICDFELIEQMHKLPTSLWNGLFDLFDWNKYAASWYAGEDAYTDTAWTQETYVILDEVPKNGYIKITNNYENEIVFMANAIDLTIDLVFAASSLSNMGADSEAVADTVNEILLEIGTEGIKNLFSEVFKKYTEGVTMSNICSIIYDISEVAKKWDVDIFEIITKNINSDKLIADTLESVVLSIVAKPVKAVLESAGYINTLIKIYDIICSSISSEIAIYTPAADDYERYSSGVRVTSETPLDPDYVLHTYIINQNDDVMTDAKPTIEAMTSNYQMYDITLYKSSQAVQPTAKITVMIPIPAGYNKNNIQVYWYKADGTLESMNAKVQGDYAVFETDHLSYYVLVEEQGHSHSYEGAAMVNATCTTNGYIIYACTCSENYTEVLTATGHNFADGQSKCSNCDYNKADSCSCKCHKSGLSKIIFKIILIFQKIFKKNKECTCGAYHY